MANRYLFHVYQLLYDKEFSYDSFDQRMEMQKAIYLLQDMGVPVGNYGFRWYKHGPYSQGLQDDMYFQSSRSNISFILSKDYTDCFKKLHNAINSTDRGNYTISHWVECLASLRYLQENLLSFDATDEEVVAALEAKKAHLNDHNTNMKAYRLLEGLFS